MAKGKGRKKKKKGPRARAAVQPREGPMVSNLVLALFTVFIIIIGSFGVSIHRADFNVEEPEELQTTNEILSTVQRDLDTEVFFLASEIISEVSEPNLAQANILFREAMTEVFEYRYDPKKIDDHRITITSPSSDLAISIMPMSMEASTCTNIVSLSGERGRMTAPAYYRVSGDVTISIQGPDGPPTQANITIDRLVPNISPYVKVRLEEFKANGKSEYTDIGRMVRYMLTTLVRFRADHGMGTSPSDTDKGLLNEGDVELAVNMAVLMEEARLFGSYDEDAVEAIDHFFYNATDAGKHIDELGWEPYNPTGLNKWGSAQIKNYAKYENVRENDRTLKSIFETYVHEGRIDPADLMALYLNLDRYENERLDLVPSDLTTILQQKNKFDRRHPDELEDISHIEYMVDVGPEELVLSDASGAFDQDYTEKLDVDHYPDYLTMGWDIHVNTNITVPYRWMTNVRLAEGSRTGGVPPPQPPPDHDWVLLWNFRIWGEFEVSVGKDVDDALEDGSGQRIALTRTIELDIPINLFTYLNDQAPNLNFTNINVGSPTGATFNFTLESKAYEHFANETWFSLKEMVGHVLADNIRLVKASTCPYQYCLASSSKMMELNAHKYLAEVPEDVWTSVKDFVDTRITGPNLSTVILKPFLNFEYFIDIDFLEATDIDHVEYMLRLTIRTNIGDINIYLMMADGTLGPGTASGYAGVMSEIEVDGLLDVGYNIEWDEDFSDVWALDHGQMGGSWSVPVQRMGRLTEQFVDIPFWDIMAVRVRTDDTSKILSLLPSGALSFDTFINDLAATWDGTSYQTIMFSKGLDMDNWTGFMAKGDALGQVLEWMEDNPDVIASMVKDDMMEPSALGMTAAMELGGLEDCYIVSYKWGRRYQTPLVYYLVYSQLFQVDRDIPMLSMRTLSNIHVDTNDDPGTPAWTTTMSYDLDAEYQLQRVEDPYG